MYPQPFENPDPNLPPKGFASKVFAYTTFSKNMNNNVERTVDLEVDPIDVLDEWNIATYRFTPKKAGYYFLSAQVGFGQANGVGRFYVRLRIYPAGTIISDVRESVTLSEVVTLNTALIWRIIPPQYIQVRCMHSTGGVVAYLGSLEDTQFSAYRIG